MARTADVGEDGGALLPLLESHPVCLRLIGGEKVVGHEMAYSGFVSKSHLELGLTLVDIFDDETLEDLIFPIHAPSLLPWEICGRRQNGRRAKVEMEIARSRDALAPAALPEGPWLE